MLINTRLQKTGGSLAFQQTQRKHIPPAKLVCSSRHCCLDSSQGGNREISASHPASSQQWVSIKDSNRLLVSLPSEADKAAETEEHIHKPPRCFSE